jgi:hypothetical protein
MRFGKLALCVLSASALASGSQVKGCREYAQELAESLGNAPWQQRMLPKASLPREWGFGDGDHMRETALSGGGTRLQFFRRSGNVLKVVQFDMRDGSPIAVEAFSLDPNDLPTDVTRIDRPQFVFFARENDASGYTEVNWFSTEPSGKTRVRRIVGEQGRDLVTSTREETSPPISAKRIQQANQARAEERRRQQEVDEIFRKWLEEYEIGEVAFQSALTEAKRSIPQASFDAQRVLAASLAMIDKPMDTQRSWIDRGRRVTIHSKAELRDLLEGKRKDDSTRFQENERYFALIDAVNGVRAAGLTDRARHATEAILATIPEHP